MSDGMGNAFASNLILEENNGFGPYGSVNYPVHSEAEIDNIMNQFMGIQEYIKMETLPYDAVSYTHLTLPTNREV